MEMALYNATTIDRASTVDRKGVRVKLRLLDGHFYDDVYFGETLHELINIIEKGDMLHMEKVNGDNIYINTKLVVDFVIS